MDVICYQENEMDTKQKIADALQERLSRIIGLDAPTDEMMDEHAFIVEKDGGYDYYWGNEKERTLLMSTRPLMCGEGVRIVADGE